MRVHVDWVTFTMDVVYRSFYPETMSAEDVYADGILGGWETTFSAKVLADVFAGKWEKRERSRAPYRDAWELTGSGIALFSSLDLTHCCVEITGVGCERLISLEMMSEVLRLVAGRCTRIDVACDIETSTKPLEFVSETSHQRMRASGHYVSDTGETCYLGSRKSDRFVRVYRYEEPHPRSHLLRIEHVFRREYAKKVCASLVELGENSVAKACGEAFGWLHRIWEPGINDAADISVVSGAREGGKTVFWLADTCGAAFRKLVKSGVIKDPDAFLKAYFL